nr:fused MFS/spermidine synthase [Actinomycetota bacterium]
APRGVAAVRRTLAPPVAWRTRLRWVGMAAIPSSLILGTTSYLSTSIAAVPLLWVVPLAAYLLSFVLAFARRPPLSPTTIRWAALASTLLVAASLLRVVPLPIAAQVAIHCGNLFAVALLVHRRLAAERPGVERLTEFYLLLSLGGVLGGAFNALAAPVLFDSIAEYPLALALAALVLPGRRALRGDVLVPTLYLAAVIGALVVAGAMGTTAVRVVLALGVASLLLLATRPVRLALCLAALLALATFGGTSLHAERTFFGVVRVVEGERGEHVLTHGTTIHGRQRLTPRRRDDPLTYYTRQGPLGQVFAARRADLRRVAVIGLGAGSIAAYGRPGDTYTFYEIDPAVARIARDRRWFTFLADSRADVRIVIGDGRLRIAEAASAEYDLIVVDAFSSDAVPAHLLTREAVELYLQKLSPRGVVAFHVTNNHLDLTPVVAGIARSLRLAGLEQDDRVSEAARENGANRSRWAVVARGEAALAGLDRRWEPLSASPRDPVWTDQFSNVLSVVEWSR